jgi:Mg-chelatase subunit ChlI
MGDSVRKYKVIALHLTGKGKKLYKSGDIVTEDQLPVPASDLMKEPHNVFIEPIEEPKPKKAKAKKQGSKNESSKASESEKEEEKAEESQVEETEKEEEKAEESQLEETEKEEVNLIPDDFELKSEDDYNKVDIVDLLDRCPGVEYDKKALKSDLYKILTEHLSNR